MCHILEFPEKRIVMEGCLAPLAYEYANEGLFLIRLRWEGKGQPTHSVQRFPHAGPWTV